MSRMYAPIRPWWALNEDAVAVHAEHGTRVPKTVVATQARQFAEPRPWQESTAPAPMRDVGGVVLTREQEATGLRFVLQVEEQAGRSRGVVASRAKAKLESLEGSIPGTLVPRTPLATQAARTFAAPVPWWEEPSPASPPAPAHNATAGGLTATLEFSRCGKVLGLALHERGKGAVTHARAVARNAAPGPRFAAPVEYWRSPSRAMATNAGGADFASRWAAVFESVRPGERAFATG